MFGPVIGPRRSIALLCLAHLFHVSMSLCNQVNGGSDDCMFGTPRPMPNFFILGATRSGTASLAQYLGQHPAIQFTQPRNPYFFLQDDLYQHGADYYAQSFCRNVDDRRWLGEASSPYFAFPHIVGPRLRIHYGNQPLKFIVLLREPVSRAWSHYLARVSHGCEKRDFATALEEEAHEPRTSRARYFAEGRYAYLLREWQTYYPLEDFIFLLSEDLAANPIAQVRRVFKWLALDTTMPINVNQRLNSAQYSRSPKMVDFLNNPPAWVRLISRQLWPDLWQRRRIRHKLRQRFQVTYDELPPVDPTIATDLRRRYRNEILLLSKSLGRYLSHWLEEEEVWEAPVPQMAY